MNRTLAGVFDPLGAAEHDAAVRAALGPGAEVWRLDALTAGHTGPPPAAGGVVCVLDGHLHDRPELARTLGLDPRADAERLVLAAWRRWGAAEMLARLRGEYALLLWERAAGTGLLARDHMGARGLAIHDDGTRLRFASDVPQLLRLLPRRPAPDRTALLHYLAFRPQPGDRTVYEGVRRLPPAHWVELGRSACRLHPYWTPCYVAPAPRPREEVVAGLRAALVRSVRRRSGEGETTAVMLSGGLDSASVTAVGSLAVDAPQRIAATYSEVFPGLPATDESSYLDALEPAYGVRSVRAAVHGGSMLAGALDHLCRWELPPVPPNDFFHAVVQRRAAADGIVAMLDGEGGDEVFGASVFLLADRLAAGRVASAIDLVHRLPGADHGLPPRVALAILARYGARGAVPAGSYDVLRRLRGAHHFAPGWLRDPDARLLLATDEEWAWKRGTGPRWWRWLAHALTRTVDAVGLHDHFRRRAHDAGLEARHPLLDVDLIEAVLAVDPELAFHPAYSRPLLREAMAGLVPDRVRLRPDKSYFTAVVRRGIAGEDRAAIGRLLSAADAEIRAYVQPAALRAEVAHAMPERHPRGVDAWTRDAWRLAVAECFLRAQADPAFPGRLRAAERLRAPDVRFTSTGAV